MNPRLSDFIATIQKRDLTIAFITAGGGAGLFDLFKIPGCSSVMNEARMLYSPESFSSFLSEHLEGDFVSQKIADKLASVLDSKTKADLCFALTCALTTNRQRHGADHGYLSICQSGNIVFRAHIPIPASDRSGQDRFVTETTLYKVLECIRNNETAL